MSDTPAAESASNESTVSKGVSTASRWGVLLAPVIALVALVFAALAYFHPTHATPTGAAQQGGDAKANVCAAYGAAHNAVVVNTHMQSPKDPTAELSVATSARLALIGSGAYLKDRLDANTAAPADIANAINSVATTIEQLGINYLNGAAADAQAALRQDLNKQIAAADKACA
jgi:hypothetical protein